MLFKHISNEITDIDWLVNRNRFVRCPHNLHPQEWDDIPILVLNFPKATLNLLKELISQELGGSMSST
jgi:hypothetical protein